MTTEKNWLASLKAGDEVIAHGSGFAGKAKIATVDRVTPTQIVVDGVRFRRTSGQQVTKDAWHWSYLEILTPEAGYQIRCQEAIRAIIRALDRNALANATAAEAEEILAKIAEIERRPA